MTDPPTREPRLPSAATMSEMPPVRSMLFMPGGRADLIATVGRFAPAVAVVDLGAAVPPGGTDAARTTAVRAID